MFAPPRRRRRRRRKWRRRSSARGPTWARVRPALRCVPCPTTGTPPRAAGATTTTGRSRRRRRRRRRRRKGVLKTQAMNEVDAGRDCAMLASSSSEEEEWREAAEGTNGNEERV